MPDAEIIPLGTRGRPGRGSGRDKPSSSSRDLWTPRKDAKPADEPVDETAGQSDEPAEAASAEQPSQPATSTPEVDPADLREPRVGEPVTGETSGNVHALQPVGGDVVPGVVLGNERPPTKTAPLGLGEILPLLTGAAE